MMPQDATRPAPLAGACKAARGRPEAGLRVAASCAYDRMACVLPVEDKKDPTVVSQGWSVVLCLMAICFEGRESVSVWAIHAALDASQIPPWLQHECDHRGRLSPAHVCTRAILEQCSRNPPQSTTRPKFPTQDGSAAPA